MAARGAPAAPAAGPHDRRRLRRRRRRRRWDDRGGAVAPSRCAGRGARGTPGRRGVERQQHRQGDVSSGPRLHDDRAQAARARARFTRDQQPRDRADRRARTRARDRVQSRAHSPTTPSPTMPMRPPTSSARPTRHAPLGSPPSSSSPRRCRSRRSARSSLATRSSSTRLRTSRGWRLALDSDGEQVIFEGSRVKSIDGTTLTTDSGSVNAERVILATHLPTLDHVGLFARAEPKASFAIAARIPGELPAGHVHGQQRDVLDPQHPRPRRRPAAGRRAESPHRPGRPGESIAKLERYARERFGASAIEYRWDAHDFVSEDRLPFVGPVTPRGDRVLTVTGLSKWGLALGAACAEMLVATVTGDGQAWPSEFDSRRLPRPKGWPALAKHGAETAVTSPAIASSARMKSSSPRVREPSSVTGSASRPSSATTTAPCGACQLAALTSGASSPSTGWQGPGTARAMARASTPTARSSRAPRPNPSAVRIEDDLECVVFLFWKAAMMKPSPDQTLPTPIEGLDLRLKALLARRSEDRRHAPLQTPPNDTSKTVGRSDGVPGRSGRCRTWHRRAVPPAARRRMRPMVRRPGQGLPPRVKSICRMAWVPCSPSWLASLSFRRMASTCCSIFRGVRLAGRRVPKGRSAKLTRSRRMPLARALQIARSPAMHRLAAASRNEKPRRTARTMARRRLPWDAFLIHTST